MKTVLVAINSSFTHTMLSVRCLESFARSRGSDCKIAEFTVNNQPETVVSSLYAENADMYAFSVYIFNVAFLRRVASDLKKAKPDCVIVLGGPEVSASDGVFRTDPYADIVMRGEGEMTFCDLLERWDEKISVHENKKRLFDARIKNLFYTYNGNSVFFGLREPPCSLDVYPFPYASLEGLEKRILYYESSRGCPFRCSYCLSAAEKGVRYRSLERTCAELKIFLDAKVNLVKFVDRTFNSDPKRALAIWKYLAENDNGVTSFHFEIAAWLINDESEEFLSKVRDGLFRFEVGIQTTNPETAKAIARPIPFEKLKSAIRRIPKTIHLHTDLIAGLPFEDYESFKRSFNDVYALGSDDLQLGFLKILRGSPMWNGKSGVFSDFPPYEVLSTPWLDYSAISKLKKNEAVLEIYANSGLCAFLKPERLSVIYNGTPFDFFEKLAKFSEKRGFFDTPRSFAGTLENIYLFLCTFLPENEANDLVAFDFYRHSRSGAFPDWLKARPDRKMLDEVSEKPRLCERLFASGCGITEQNIKSIYKNSFGVSFTFSFDGNKLCKENRKILFVYGEKTTVVDVSE